MHMYIYDHTLVKISTSKHSSNCHSSNNICLKFQPSPIKHWLSLMQDCTDLCSSEHGPHHLPQPVSRGLTSTQPRRVAFELWGCSFFQGPLNVGLSTFFLCSVSPRFLLEPTMNGNCHCKSLVKQIWHASAWLIRGSQVKIGTKLSYSERSCGKSKKNWHLSEIRICLICTPVHIFMEDNSLSMSNWVYI